MVGGFTIVLAVSAFFFLLFPFFSSVVVVVIVLLSFVFVVASWQPLVRWTEYTISDYWLHTLTNKRALLTTSRPMKESDTGHALYVHAPVEVTLVIRPRELHEQPTSPSGSHSGTSIGSRPATTDPDFTQLWHTRPRVVSSLNECVLHW